MQTASDNGARQLVPVPPGRVPPYSLDAERSVLGGSMLDNSAIDELLEVVRPEDFYREAHRKTFEAMVQLAARREPVDRVTVKDELRSMGALDAIGGEAFVDLLDTVVPSSSNLLYYGTIVREKATARRIIEAAHVIASQGYEGAGTVSDFIDEAESRMLAACEVRNAGEGPVLARQAVLEVFKQLEEQYSSESEITGLPSGFAALDELTTGFQPGNLVILAARPSLGKTALLLQWFLHIVFRCSKAAALFELEMTKAELVKRAASQEENIEADRLRKPKLMREGDWAAMARFAGRISEAPLYIDDQPGLTATEIRARARRIRAKCSGTTRPLGAIGVDHAQLMGGEGRTDEERITRNSKALKELAKELGVPVILLSQLNRELEKRSDRRPQLSDLRGSGSLEQDGDLIIFLHKDKEGPEFIIGKQRNGPLGVVRVEWNAKFTRFENEGGSSSNTRQRAFFEQAPPQTDDDRRGD